MTEGCCLGSDLVAPQKEAQSSAKQRLGSGDVNLHVANLFSYKNLSPEASVLRIFSDDFGNFQKSKESS